MRLLLKEHQILFMKYGVLGDVDYQEKGKRFGKGFQAFIIVDIPNGKGEEEEKLDNEISHIMEDVDIDELK